jgi:transposase
MDVPPLTPEMIAEFPPAAVELIRQLFQVIEARSAIIAQQTAKIAELEARLNLNSRNSSKPPSSDGPALKRAPPKPAGDKKPGGQPGHPKKSREIIPTEQCDEVIVCRPSICRNCSAPLSGSDIDPLRHQVFEMPAVKPAVREYQLHRLVCPCGCSTAGVLPEGVAGQDGPRLRACVALLTGAFRLSKRKASRLPGDLFNIPMSAGQICSLEARFAEELQPVADEILSAVRKRPAYVDETSMGRKHVLWVMVTSIATYDQIVADRTRWRLRQMLDENHQQVLTTDRHSIDSRLPAGRHQLCRAHLRRDFQAMIDRNTPGSATGRELLSLSDELFDHWQRVRDGTLLKSTLKKLMRASGEFRTRFKEALERGAAGGCRRTARTRGKLLSQEASLYRFVFCDEVEPANNAAERALRHGVIWRKQSHGPKSETGARYLATVWSVTETCLQQGRNVWNFLAECLIAADEGRPLPRLTTADAEAQAA